MSIIEKNKRQSAGVSVADYLCAALEANGIDTVFGIPGIHNVELYRGLAGCGISHITPRNEQGAGFMADGYARSCGKVAACFVITGPGLTNIATAMGQALADSIPMLVISSVNPVGAMGSGQGWLHEMPDQRAFVSQVSAFSHTIFEPEELPVVLVRAFAVFYSARPAPVHIEIPVNIFSKSMPQDSVVGKKFSLPLKSCASPDEVSQVVDWLGKAQNPVIIAGGGAGGASDEIRWLAENIDAPVIMTSNGRGILSPSHPLALPCSPALDPVRRLMREADLILALGTELGSSEYYFANHTAIDFQGKLVRIDIDVQQLMRTPRSDMSILSDCQSALSLLKSVWVAQARLSNAEQEVNKVKQQIHHETSLPYRASQAMLAQIAESLPESIIVGDSTQPVYAGMMNFAAPRPRSWFCSATGFGTLGYAISAATGAWIASKRPVVSVIGDGGLMFNLGEIMTARQIECPLIILLWNNHGYQEIKTYMENRDIPPLGVDLFRPDFEKMAQSFDCAYEFLLNQENLKNILEFAAKRNRPTIIEVDEAQFISYFENCSTFSLF